MSRFGPRGLHLVLVLAALACLTRATLMGISDPSEGRYAEIAREMVESGDWVVPHWFGVVHLEKPPLAYWAGAAGLEIFGRNQFAIRFFPLLALLLAAWLTAKMARRLLGPEAEARAAAVVGLAPYSVMVGAALLTDVFLMLATALFAFGLLKRLEEGDRRALDWTAVALGIGFLAKGHAILLFTILPLAIARSGVFRELFRPRRLLIMALLVLPWPAAVQVRYPDFLPLQALKLFDFVATGQEHHHAPIFTYLLVLLVGLAPFSLYLVRGLRRPKGPSLRYLRLALLLPLVVLTAIPSRSWTYIFPTLPCAALFIARGWNPLRGARIRKPLAIVSLAAAAALVLVAVWGLPASEKLRPWFVFLPVVAGVLACIGLWLFWARRRTALVVAGGTALLVNAAVILAARTYEEPFHIHRRVAEFVREIAGEKRKVILVGTARPSIGFYLDRPVVIAGEYGRLDVEAILWGGSDRYLVGSNCKRLLRIDRSSVFVLSTRQLAEFAPERQPRLVAGKTAVVTGPASER